MELTADPFEAQNDRLQGIRRGRPVSRYFTPITVQGDSLVRFRDVLPRILSYRLDSPMNMKKNSRDICLSQESLAVGSTGGYRRTPSPSFFRWKLNTAILRISTGLSFSRKEAEPAGNRSLDFLP